jgi:hypothetical protein
MLNTPDFVLDPYKRYKAETQKVDTRLFKTASDWTPYTPPNLYQSKRKWHKRSDPSFTKIPIIEFSLLAQTIAGADLPIKIPRGILHSLKNAIEKRKRCAEWCSKQAWDELHEQSNLGHPHFIAVFVEVFDFPSASLTRYIESKNNEEPEVSPLQDSNLFGNFDIEESMSDDEVGQ